MLHEYLIKVPTYATRRTALIPERLLHCTNDASKCLHLEVKLSHVHPRCIVSVRVN